MAQSYGTAFAWLALSLVDIGIQQGHPRRMNRLIWLLAASSLAVTVAGCGDDASSLECGANTSEVDGVCVADVSDTTCGTGTVASGTECVPDGSVICETGTTFEMASGTCVADITGCGAGTVVVDGECKDPADVTTDISEAAEPNDLGGTPGTFDVPAVGDAITISGCIEPTEVDGDVLADFDSYVFATSGSALLDITVDGIGGAAGAFQLQTGDEELFDAGFQRFGVNLANDMSQRTLFLPKAANFAISFGDSRTIVSGFPAGGPEACYVATIRNVAIPAATAATPGTALDGTFSADTQFLGLTPAADGTIARSLTSAANANALVDSVLMVNDTYQSSNAGLGTRDFGADAANVAGGLNAADDIVYVIDPVINLSLFPVDFSHLITDVPVVAMATDGSSVSVPSPNNDGGSFISFDVASTDDVIFLDLDAAGFSTDVDWFILNSSLERVATIDTFSGGQEAGHYRFEETGVHYIEIQDFSGSTVDPFNFVSTQVDHTPTALTVGTPVAAQTFGADNATFYTVTPGAFEWWNITGTPTAFDDDMLLSVFDDGESGKLFADVTTVADFVLVDGEDNLQLLENADPVLLMISDDSTTPNAAATFDFSIADNVFTDLGTVAAAAPVNSVVTGATADEYYIASANNGETINVVVTGNAGLDPILVLVTAEGETFVDANTGADTTEQNFTFAANGVIAFAIRDVAGVGGDYTLDLSIVESQNLTSAPGVAIPDNDAAGVQDTITAAACTIGAINVDLDVNHTFIGDLLVTVTSPTGTVVTLHNRSGGGADDIVGNYNGTLTSADDLTVLNGEEALGDWIISIDDNFNADTGDLNSWGLNMVCL